ncbi:MAG: recombination protein RecR [Clostridia bacterium]|nr:recombination protein RecR [Clostridia bacterium]MBR4658536.1 recombination protein RecR [Clostridia bacterium]
MSTRSLENLTARLNRLPGIGIKTAQRLAYHILALPEEDVEGLSSALLDARRRIHYCPVCGNFTEEELCDICSDPKRDPSVICVVKDARDVSYLERMREYRGLYHVLGGTLSPMDGVGPEDIRINELTERVKKGEVTEVILATNPDVEGEATASYIAKQLKPLGVKTTRIAHGIPIGGNLEFVDEITLFKAIENRREV